MIQASCRGVIFVCGLLFISQVLSAAEIRCAGILGNSGEYDQTLIHFGSDSTKGSFNSRGVSGIGVVVDRYGSLWARGGAGVLNRYALDGRLLATYSIPIESSSSDAIALSGGTVMLRLGQGVYTLSVDAPSGTHAKSLEIAADLMSLAASDGKVIASKGSDIFLLSETGEKSAVTTLKKPPEWLAYGPDGAIYFAQSGKLYRVSNPGTDPVVAGSIPGERFQFINGFWYGHGHHSTIRRFDANLQLAPGVVMGGNSGSFIGHVDEQAEVVNGRGLVRISPDLFAVSGTGGVLHLLEWKTKDARFAPIRRIGAVPACDAMALDRDGRIWFKSGNWNWDDGPATPMRNGIPEPESVFGLTVFSNSSADVVSGYGGLWGKPSIIFGKLDKEVHIARLEAQTSLPKEARAVVISAHRKKRELLVLDRSGGIEAVRLGEDGNYLGDSAPVEFHTSLAVKEWTSLVSDGSTLFGAADGYVIELASDGENFKETKRWNSWGTLPVSKFGASIYLAADAGNLWVSDSARQRLVCLSADKHELLAAFGELDRPGDDLLHLSEPRTLACRGSRAVVFDSGNQRFVKLSLSK